MFLATHVSAAVVAAGVEAEDKLSLDVLSGSEGLVAELSKGEVVRRALAGLVSRESPHARLPPERKLAEEIGVNRVTVRRALDNLERAGAIYRVQGAGTFVAARRVTKGNELTSFSEDMRQRGLEPGARNVRISSWTATPVLANVLEVAVGSVVTRIERVRLGDGLPLCLEDAYLPGIVDAEAVAELGTGSLYELLRRSLGIEAITATQVIRSVILTAEEAAALELADGAPALYVERTLRDSRDRAVEYSVSKYRADRYDFENTLRRE